jgi:hypothetical protein
MAGKGRGKMDKLKKMMGVNQDAMMSIVSSGDIVLKTPAEYAVRTIHPENHALGGGIFSIPSVQPSLGTGLLVSSRIQHSHLRALH